VIQVRGNQTGSANSRSSLTIPGSGTLFCSRGWLTLIVPEARLSQPIAVALISGILMLLSLLSTGMAMATTVPDGNGAIAMTQDSAGDTYVLNADGSTGSLSGQAAGTGCSPAAIGLPAKPTAGRLLFDATSNRLYVATLTSTGLSVFYGTVSSATCTVSSIVNLPEEDPVAGFSITLDNSNPTLYSNLYVVAPAGPNGTTDFLYVLNTNGFGSHSSATPPPSYSLDYESEYGPVIFDGIGGRGNPSRPFRAPTDNVQYYLRSPRRDATP
jgi:hypothetical protein